jgi:hypothetical protein
MQRARRSRGRFRTTGAPPHPAVQRVPVPLGLEVEPDDEPLGLDVEPLGDELLGGVDGVVEGEVEDGGDAEGVRSPGRSPTRSVRDSLQAVSIPRLSATAQMPVSILFIGEPPPCGVASTASVVQRRCRRPFLTGIRVTITNAGDAPR